MPWIKSGELPDGLITHHEEQISDDALKNSSAKVFPEGTLLIALYGATVGKLGVLSYPAATNQAVCALESPPALVRDYLFYFLLYSRAALIKLGQGGAQPNISQTILKEFPLPLAPTNEQRRIVAKIDELFSRIDAGEKALEKVQGLLKTYRQSVLKAAVTGELTKSWRAKAAGNDETGDDLLKRILKARREAWEAQELAKMKAKGKAPKDDEWKQKYKEPDAPDTKGLPDLPKGWTYADVDVVCEVTKLAGFEYTKFVKYDTTGDLPVVKAENVAKKDFDTSEMSRVDSMTVSHLARSKLYGREVLMVFVGANLGRVALVPSGPKYFLGPNVALIRVASPYLLPEYLELFFDSDLGFQQALNLSVGAAQGSISMGRIRQIRLSLPSIDEQEVVVSKIKEFYQRIDGLERDMAARVKMSAGLRQSVLRAAFSGQLVAQDPSDESTSVFLERIAAERTTPDSGPQRGRKSKKPPSTDMKAAL